MINLLCFIKQNKTWKNFSLISNIDQAINKRMLKFVAFVTLLVLVSAQSGPGIEDDRCPPGTPDPPKHLPNDSDCSKFFKCENSLAVPFDCPEGQHWSVKNDVCDWPE